MCLKSFKQALNDLEEGKTARSESKNVMKIQLDGKFVWGTRE